MADKWIETTLGSVADFLSGGTPSKSRAENWDGSIPWVSAKDMKRFRLEDTEDHITEAGLRDGTKLVPADTVLLLVRGMTLLNDLPICVVQRSVTFNQDVKALRPNSNVVPEFLPYLLLGNKARILSLVDLAGHGTGRLNSDELKALEVVLPPLYEQRAIAHILGTLDDKIELNRRMNETLEAMARALFKSWFVDFEPVRAKMEGRWKRGQSLPGLPAHLYDLFPDRLVPSELGEIPEGWEAGTLGDVAENPRRSIQPDQIEPSTPYIALEHMPKKCIALSNWGIGNGLESNKFEFRRGEILFGKLRPYFHKVGVAPVDGVCSTDIVVVTPKARTWFGFVLAHVSSVEFVDYTNAGSTGTKMPRTNWKDMARYELVLPQEPVVAAFSEIIQPLVDRILASIYESRSLDALRDTLLPKLISGEVCVTDAERFLERRGL
ncbi:MAG TPA: restriction endonuclease subunit S [Thiotrichales bacterium]|nr:restriction endonuclease subunit S [Thiotrichales bacterium]